MFIVCPSCSGPYRISADQIAPLVQVACPHCEYRVILDFEAANDPALREPGHQFAQGYESAEAYFSVYSHVGKQPDARPFAAPGIAAGAAATTAAPPVAATGTGGLASPGTSARTPLADVAPSAVQPTATASAGPSPSKSSPGLGQVARSSAAKTVIQQPSKKPVSMDPTVEPLAPRPKAPSGPTMHAGAGSEKVKPLDTPEAKVDTKVETPAETPSEKRAPPHTPPSANHVSSGPHPEPAPTKAPEDPAAQSNSNLTKSSDPKPLEAATKPGETKTPEKPPEKVVPKETQSSGTILYVIVVLLLIAVAVVVYLNRG